MNFVDIIGGSKKQRDLINDVVYFCINRLMPKMKTLDIKGFEFNPVFSKWKISDNLSVNYILCSTKN